MSILQNIKNLWASVVKGAANPGIFGFFNPTDMPRMNEKEALKAYRGWVFACTNAIAERVADMEIKLQKWNVKTNDWQDIDEHPALDVLHHVNDFVTLYELLYSYAAYQELNGNSFWYLPRAGQNKSGPPVEIWPLDPTRVNIIKSKADFIAGYVYTNEMGVKVPLTPSEVLHWAHFNPMSKYRGMGTVEAAGLAIDTDTYASEWQRNFFGNSAMPSALLSTEGTLSDEQYGRIRANWDSKYKGVQNAHKMAIMEGGLKFTPLNPTMREMQFDNSRKTIRDEILAIFRVPKVILGITEDVNFAAAQATEYVFGKYVIKPKMVFFVSKLNEYYLPLFNLDPYEYRFAFTDPVPDNIDQQISIRASAIEHYYMTPNEARAQIGELPIEGGDKLYIPNTMSPMGEPTPPAGDGTDTTTPKALRELKKRVMQKRINKKRKYAVKKEAVAARKTYIDAQVKTATKTYKELNDQLKNLILTNAQSKAARAVFTKEHKPAGPVSKLAKSMGLVNKADETAGDLVRLLFTNYNEWVGLVYNASKEQMTKVLGDSGKVALAEVNVDTDFDLENPRATDWLQKNALENATSYSGTLKDDIGQVVTDGVANGESIPDITASIGAFFDGQSDYRAERLARTETGDAYSQGSLEGYKQSGVVAGKEWLADDSACDVCLGNEDDGVIPLDDDFSSGDDSPTAHPNCECSLQPVVEGDEG